VSHCHAQPPLNLKTGEIYFDKYGEYLSDVDIYATTQLKEAGKQAKVIVCAVIRKLVHIIYRVLKSNQPFDVNHKNFA